MIGIIILERGIFIPSNLSYAYTTNSKIIVVYLFGSDYHVWDILSENILLMRFLIYIVIVVLAKNMMLELN